MPGQNSSARRWAARLPVNPQAGWTDALVLTAASGCDGTVVVGADDDLSPQQDSCQGGPRGPPHVLQGAWASHPGCLPRSPLDLASRMPHEGRRAAQGEREEPAAREDAGVTAGLEGRSRRGKPGTRTLASP